MEFGNVFVADLDVAYGESDLSSIVYVQAHLDPYAQDDCSTDFVDVMARNESAPTCAAALSRARSRFAQRLKTTRGSSLAQIRLGKGLSQKQLAERIGTQQPSIARMEAGSADPLLSTIERLAAALDVSVPDVVTAIKAKSL